MVSASARLKRLLFRLDFAWRWWFSRLFPFDSRPIRLVLLTQMRNEMEHLPGFIRNVVPQVDALIALDDASSDGSAAYLESCPKLAHLIRKPAREPHVWNEAENKRLLIEAAKAHLPCWVLVLDADERLEQNFRQRAELAIRLAHRYGFSAVSIKLGELWNHRDQIRADGIWRRKWRVRLFELHAGHEVAVALLHAPWHSMKRNGPLDIVAADLRFYHLGMLTARQREKRRERYKTLDPDCAYQAIGYDYLTDEKGIRLERLTADRHFMD